MDFQQSATSCSASLTTSHNSKFLRISGSTSLNGRWHGKQFQVRRTLRSGATMTESYELKKSGRRLVVHVRIQRENSDTQMPEFQRVYDRYGQ